MAVTDLRKIEVRHKHSRHWLWYVTAISFVTGALLAASIRTQSEWKKALPTIPSWRPEVIAQYYKNSQAENEKQKREIEGLHNQLSEYQEAALKGNHDQALVFQDLQRSKVLLGFTELKGPGIVLTLKDSPLKPPSTDLQDQESFILHDYDLQRVVNELYVAGAEAIAINDQRLVGRTAIRCVGPVVHINSQPVAPPFVIRAIGDPKVLKTGLLIRGGIIDQMLQPLGFVESIQTPPVIHIPAYSGAVELRYAKAVETKDTTGAEEGDKQ